MAWQIFKKYHYLSESLNHSGKCFGLFWEETMIGFISIIHFVHPLVKNMKKVHRLVVLPDYQGFGFGMILLNEVGKVYLENGFRFGITTSNPALFAGLRKQNNWKLKRNGRTIGRHKNIKTLNKTVSSNRNTLTFEMLK